MARDTDNETPSLRRQLGIPLLKLGLGGALLAMLSVGFLVYNSHNRLLERQLHVLIHLLTPELQQHLQAGDLPALQRSLAKLRFQQGVGSVCVFQQQGYLYASFPQQPDPPCPQHIDLKSIQDGKVETGLSRLVIHMPLGQSPSLTGMLRVQQNKAYILEELAGLLALLTLITVIGLFLAFGMLSRFFDQALEPLEALSEAAVNARKSGSAMPRVHKQRQDEIGVLVDNFNHMLDAMEEKQQALQQSESRFRLLTDHSPVGILQRNERFDLVFANPRLLMLIGQPDKTRISRNQWLEGVHPDDLSRFLAFQDRMCDSRQNGSLEYRFRPLGQRDYRVFVEHLAILDQGTEQPLTFVGSVMDITDLKQAQEKLEYQALYDPLTGLPNRNHCREMLEQMLNERNDADSQPFAVMFLDLDNFKKINDTLGHDTGDEVLVQVARRLHGTVQILDVFIGRMGGDEFLLLLKTLPETDTVDVCTNLVARNFRHPLALGERSVDITFSIGVALYPNHGRDASVLLKHADVALYASKHAGRNRSTLFNQAMEEQLETQQRIQLRLKQALQSPGENGMTLAVQPQIDLHTNRMVSGEVLCRWHDPELGPVPPHQFIAIAEETGDILKLGHWVMTDTCRLQAMHRQALSDQGILKLAINLSSRQFFEPGLLDRMLACLNARGISPDMLEVELTESVLLDDLDAAMEIMNAMRDAGLHIALDDFGTGFSSMSYLRRLPITALKIDRSFIHEIHKSKPDREIVSAILHMAGKLGIQTVAEGVENSSQLALLRMLGCNLAQGYLLGRPMPMDEFIRYQWPCP